MAGAELGGTGTMNPYWVEKAKRAFETGQPRMAELYMRRGLSETAAGRQWLKARDEWEAMKAAYRAFGATVDRLAEIGQGILDAFGWGVSSHYQPGGHTGVDYAIPYPKPPYLSQTIERRSQELMAQFRAELHAEMAIRPPHNFKIGGIA